MNYFELFELPVSFVLDEKQLKQTFYRLSKEYHPDFHTMASKERQAEILELSTMTNEGYKVLSDFDKRMAYVLTLKNALDEEGQAKLPQDFLMEMMTINEQLMELEFDFDESVYTSTLQQIEQQSASLQDTITPILALANDQQFSPTSLDKMKDYYYKNRYLLRIRENLNKFAPR